MNIVICVKQVPDTAHLKFDSGNNLLLEGSENILNPFDEYAIETALRIKDAHEGTKITVISMGSTQAKEALKRALAMGADEAFLLSEQGFQNSDPWATAFTLNHAIRKLVPDYQLLLFGQLATDDMAGFTGPAVAAFLDLPSVTFCKNIELKDANTVTIHRETEQGIEIYEMSLPGLAAVMKCDYEPRIPSIKGVMKANRTEIPTIDLAGLGLNANEVGQEGSMTQVLKTWRKPKKEGGVKVDGSNPDNAVKELIGFLKTQKAL